jgi:hypothetical protein
VIPGLVRTEAKESGIYAFERYFNSQDAGLEPRAMAWLEDGGGGRRTERAGNPDHAFP